MAKPTSSSATQMLSRFQSEGTLSWIPDLLAIGSLVALVALFVGTFA